MMVRATRVHVMAMMMVMMMMKLMMAMIMKAMKIIMMAMIMTTTMMMMMMMMAGSRMHVLATRAPFAPGAPLQEMDEILCSTQQ